MTTWKDNSIIISKERPPIYTRFLQRFGGVEWEHSDDVIAYDGVIYSKIELSPDKLVHEMKHIEQQRKYTEGIAAYVDRYFNDGEFRMNQEAEAFRAQLTYLESEKPPRPDLPWIKEKFARDLCNWDIYDLEITHAAALRLLS